MSLRTYEKKRDFSVTSEPRVRKRASGEEPIFVVQLHLARVRHYDFRLQVGDALKSWAVPKGPSFDPAVKRLAVEVEDHPLDYANFEGDIPSGQYGAGHVDIFDHGTWSTTDNPRNQLAKGHLEFELHGRRLNGAWHLVRTRRPAKQPQWLLVKGDDNFASTTEADDLLEVTKLQTRSAAKQTKKTTSTRTSRTRRHSNDWAKRALGIPKASKAPIKAEPFAPQLARSAASAPAGDGWLHETKWDGYRILTTIVKGHVQLWSRNALEWTDRIPALVEAIASLKLDSAQFDGELIVNTDTRESFNELQAVLAGESNAPLLYALFDLPYIDGVSLADCGLLRRKALLQELLTDAPRHLFYSDHHIGDGAMVFDAAGKRGLEGILSKRVDSPYRSGRGKEWLKVKHVLSDEFAIVGYTKGRGSRTRLGALLLARAGKDGWHYVGRMGSGFSDTTLRQLGKLLPKLQRDAAPVSETSLVGRDTGKPIWIEPKYVVEVYYRGMGKEGLLRQASLKTLREDKSATDLQREPDRAIAPVAPEAKSHERPRRAQSTKARAGRPRSPAPPKPRAFDPYLTHPERVVFPDDGYTKQQVGDYYEQVMPYLLPQIARRPLSLVRCPDGAKRACFFQKHHAPHIGEHVRALPLRDSQGAKVNYLFVEDADGIRNLVQMNVLEFHPWGTSVDDLENCDLLVFDLDPGPNVAWRKVIAAAELLRSLLLDLKLRSFVKLSGGKGLHVTVPLQPAQPWDIAKQFCRQLAASLAQHQPKDFIDVATKSRRVGRIFVDYLRNSRGATSVAAYSLRARSGAPVAMPIEWEELGSVRNAVPYTLKNTPAYLATRKRDPWQEIGDLRQTLTVHSSAPAHRRPK